VPVLVAGAAAADTALMLRAGDGAGYWAQLAGDSCSCWEGVDATQLPRKGCGCLLCVLFVTLL
jgi:hypothetical protein